MTPTQTLNEPSKPPNPNPPPNSAPKLKSEPPTEEPPNSDVDILNSDDESNLGAINFNKNENDLDKTECSSSFGDTLSGSCSEMNNHEMSDSEVESPFARLNGEQQNHLSDFLPRLYKKKKVTPHWRKFISPLIYRCQWLELRIKEIQTQSLKYEKELKFIKQEKEVHSRMIELDSSSSRIIPFSSKFRNKKAMKRRKRRKEEETFDGLSYFSDHVVFSCYENKKAETDGHSVNDDCADPVEETNKGNEESEWIFRPNCTDNFFIKVLLKIDSLQSRVQTLKSQLKSATSKKLKKPSQLLITNNSTTQSPPVQTNGNNNNNNVNNISINNNNGLSEDDDVADPGLPGSAVSSFGEAADVAMPESSSRFPFADVAQIQDLCKEETVEDVLIDNQVIISGDQYPHPIEMRQVSIIKTEPSEEESTAPISISSKEDEQTTSLSDQDLSNLKLNQESNLNLDLKSNSNPNSGLFLKRCYTGKRRGRRPNKNLTINSGIISSNNVNNNSNGSNDKLAIKGKRSSMVMLASSSAGGPWRSERIKKPKIRD
ncbi:hypothetical protein LUZ60_007633 [Juncus effusus]|nr:hypothetical protein LUZ60_007633 [Juncus effusus]